MVAFPGHAVDDGMVGTRPNRLSVPGLFLVLFLVPPPVRLLDLRPVRHDLVLAIIDLTSKPGPELLLLPNVLLPVLFPVLFIVLFLVPLPVLYSYLTLASPHPASDFTELSIES